MCCAPVAARPAETPAGRRRALRLRRQGPHGPAQNGRRGLKIVFGEIADPPARGRPEVGHRTAALRDFSVRHRALALPAHDHFMLYRADRPLAIVGMPATTRTEPR